MAGVNFKQVDRNKLMMDLARNGLFYDVIRATTETQYQEGRPYDMRTS